MHALSAFKAYVGLVRHRHATAALLLLSFAMVARASAQTFTVKVDLYDCEALLDWPAYKQYTGLSECRGDTRCSRLKGVTCNSQGSVTDINLQNRGLKGPLPSSLRPLLPGLRTLDLSNNLLTGTLPALWRISGQLKTLNLQNNRLVGTLPPTWGRLGRLSILNLRNNQLIGTLPRQWNTLSSLASLNLESNQLAGTLPESWSSLAALSSLNLQGNQLTGALPNEWSRLPSINSLILRGNHFKGSLPGRWGSMTSLQLLDLGNNNIESEVPIEWGRLLRLQTLRLRENRLFNSLPPEWARMSNLRELDVGTNPELEGSLPSEWSSLSSLQQLFLDGTTVTGMLPRTWGLLENLKAMYLSSNIFGPIPPSWTRQATGVTLYLPANSELCDREDRPTPRGVVTLNAISGMPQTLPLCDPKVPWDIEGFRVGTIVRFSKDGRCGGATKTVCPNGFCCSLSGWCGKSDEHCSPYKGCNINWGNCTNKGTKLPLTKDGFCGAPRKTSCPAGLCCNKAGVCGAGDADCKNSNGCQSNYGVCSATGNPFAFRVYAAGSPAGGGLTAARALNGTANILLKNRCQLPSFLPPRSSKPCINYVVPTNGLTLDKIAAMHGTNPYQIKIDNLIYSDGIVAFARGDVVAIRPADGNEGVNRWSPKQIPYRGALDESLGRPCSGFLFEADKATCFCSYHPEGSFVWPFSGDCSVLIVCSNGQYDRMVACPWGTVADEGDEFNGNSICVPRPANF